MQQNTLSTAGYDAIAQRAADTAAQVETLAQRGIERVREAGQAVGERAARAGDRTVDYIRDEPVKSVLIAAAAGAGLAALVAVLAGRRGAGQA
ncbi:MAG: hypothetical protein KBC73_25630 [Burkholderiaceae bacterium]|nr:hypothetical protein [Burkholderiaceae bacterium]